MFRFIIILLAVAVSVAGFNADAKKKRRSHKSTAKKTIVQPEPKGYQALQCDDEGVIDFENAKYPPEYPGGVDTCETYLRRSREHRRVPHRNTKESEEKARPDTYS